MKEFKLYSTAHPEELPNEFNFQGVQMLRLKDEYISISSKNIIMLGLDKVVVYLNKRIFDETTVYAIGQLGFRIECKISRGFIDSTIHTLNFLHNTGKQFNYETEIPNNSGELLQYVRKNFMRKIFFEILENFFKELQP